MISIVNSVDAYHTSYVSREVDKLNGKGYEVNKITRVSKKIIGIFGEDVTHIHYKKPATK